MEKQCARVMKGHQESSSLRFQGRRVNDTTNERRRDAMQYDGQLKKLFDELPTIVGQRLKAGGDQAETLNDAKIQKIIEENVRTYTLSDEEYQRYVLEYIRLYRSIEKRVYEELPNGESTRHYTRMLFGTDMQDALAYVDRVIAPREAAALASMSHLPLKVDERSSGENASALAQNANASTMPKSSHAVLDTSVTYVVEDEELLPLEAAFVDLTQSTELNERSSIDDVGAEWDDIDEEDFIDI